MDPLEELWNSLWDVSNNVHFNTLSKRIPLLDSLMYTEMKTDELEFLNDFGKRGFLKMPEGYL